MLRYQNNSITTGEINVRASYHEVDLPFLLHTWAIYNSSVGSEVNKIAYQIS